MRVSWTEEVDYQTLSFGPSRRSALADDAACGESRNLSSRAGDHDAAATGSKRRRNGFDLVLPGEQGSGKGLSHSEMETIRTISWMKEKAGKRDRSSE